MDMAKIIKKQKKSPAKAIEMEPIDIFHPDDVKKMKPKESKLELDMLLSSAGKKSLKEFKSKSPAEQFDVIRKISPANKRQDTRNEALKILDQEQRRFEKLFEREKGSFSPEMEMQKEDKIKKAIEETNIPEESKKKYLRLLEKRMRTA